MFCVLAAHNRELIRPSLDLNVVGTLGLLAKAKTLGLIDSFRDAALSMQRQGIYYNTSLIQRLAQQLGES